MSKTWGRRALGIVPPARQRVRVPRQRQVATVPKGDPIAQPPVPQVSRPPQGRAVGAVPNPRRPKLVRDVGGGALKDLFAIFPDLPRPPRPAPRLPARRKKARR